MARASRVTLGVLAALLAGCGPAGVSSSRNGRATGRWAEWRGRCVLPSAVLPGNLEVGSWRRASAPVWLDRPLPCPPAMATPLDAGAVPPLAWLRTHYRGGLLAAYHLATEPRTLVFVSAMAFADADRAFAGYAACRPPQTSSIPIGADSYRVASGLRVWKGRYVVFVDAPGVTASRREAVLRVFALAAAKRIGGPDELAGTLARLPRQGLRIDLSAWRAQGVYGRAYLGEGLEVAYRHAVAAPLPERRGRATSDGSDPGEPAAREAGSNASGPGTRPAPCTALVFVAERRSKREATEAVGRLRRELRQAGQLPADLVLGDEAFVSTPRKGVHLSVFVVGRTVVGIEGNLADPMLDRMRRDLFTGLGGRIRAPAE